MKIVFSMLETLFSYFSVTMRKYKDKQGGVRYDLK
jgi:hypothetical protein